MSYSEFDKINSLNRSSRGSITELRKPNIKLLNQGGYGCVYTPALKCDNETDSNKDPSNYILKLQVMNTSAENEIALGKLISNIPNWKEHFAPIENKCNVDIRKIDKNLLDEYGSTCRIFEKSDNLIALTIPYIRDGSFTKNIIQPKHDRTFPCLVHSYEDILLSLQLLKKADIVHYDLKNDNLLYNNVLNKPIIIDFGLSIPFKEVKTIIKNHKSPSSARSTSSSGMMTSSSSSSSSSSRYSSSDISSYGSELTSITGGSSNTFKQLKKYFYVFATEYYLWCLEIHFICYLLHYDKGYNGLTKEIVQEICSVYVRENKAFNTFSNDFLENYINLSIEYYSQFIGRAPEYTIFKLIDNYQTWDNYSLSIVFIKLLSNIYKQKTNNTIQFFYELFIAEYAS